MDTNYEQTSLLDEQDTNVQRPVECLGLTFDSDEARRAYFLEILREKLRDPEFRKIEGFPIGDDDDILALSDPPYYTACPNPFIGDFIKYYGRPYDPNIPYRREPFAADVSEGKNDPIYNAHSYHTKVPHKAIMRYILHYTEPGDFVFDGFCGTGMTGVASQLCGDHKEVESLGYRVLDDGTILNENAKPFSKLGRRYVILNDISPVAAFIAYNYNTPKDVAEFEQAAKRILGEIEQEYGWMYLTLHQPNQIQIEKAILLLESRASKPMFRDADLPWARINYVVWSDVFVCPECSHELIFREVAVDHQTGNVRDMFQCPYCQVRLTKRSLNNVKITQFDNAISQTVRQTKQVPVLIRYTLGKKHFEKKPDAFDLALLLKIENNEFIYAFPKNRMPVGDEARRNDERGITHIHQFYTKRSLSVLATLIEKASKISDRTTSNMCMFMFEQWIIGFSKLNRYSPHHFSQNNRNLSGTLYIGSQVSEVSPEYAFTEKLKRLVKAFKNLNMKYYTINSVGSSTALKIPANSIEYIFTDPPFGGNLMYSELNFLWEAWLKLFTNSNQEAIENKVQGKGLLEYQQLMTSCFQEFYRILKPGRWMTVEFHNSRNSVWNAIQEALQHAGFIIADVRTLDKQQGTFKQVTSGGAVKQDLIISTYKPNEGLEERFRLVAGSEEGTWDFVRAHLRQLPVFVSKDGQAEVIAERMNYLLFDRMVAYHVQRGVTVPLSSSEFYAGVVQRFPERDGMYFLPDQVAEYDKKRITVKDVLQLQLLVIDESSAIQWLRQNLTKKPQTFQDIHPQFMKELGGWQKYEKQLELSDLLEQNFLRYDGKGEVPSQIHSYLSTNFKELRNLDKGNPELRAKAKDRWYVPDPNKAIDLEKLREKALLKEFDEYKNFNGRQLKIFRLEAVRAGFKKAWQERDYQTILDVAHNIPENVLQEDTKLLMWYDQAKIRTGDEW